MSVEAIAIALHHSRAKGSAKLVLIGIANHLGDGGSWPAMSTLAKYASVSRDQARKCVQDLIKLGEVERAVQAGGTNRTPDHERTNRYEFRLKCPPWCDRTHWHRDTRDMDLDRAVAALEALPIYGEPAVDNTPQRIGGGVAGEGAPPSNLRDETYLETSTTGSSSSSSSNRARESAAACPTTGQGHRWNRKHRWCADCQAPMGSSR